MRKTNSIFGGIVLVLTGMALILVQTNVIEFDWNLLWPAVMILIGIMFHVQFFAHKEHNAGLLVPGGILLVYGCFFMYLKLAGWSEAGMLWPVFLLGPAFGLFELKLFSRGRQGSWVPVLILTAIAAFFLIKENFSSSSIAAASALIVMGIVIIIGSFFGKNKKGKKKIDVKIDVE